MGLLPDTSNCGLHMRRECRERFLRHRLQRKPLVSNPGMHHGTWGTHVPCCMSGSLTRGDGENVPGIPGSCAARNFTHMAWGPYHNFPSHSPMIHQWSRPILPLIVLPYGTKRLPDPIILLADKISRSIYKYNSLGSFFVSTIIRCLTLCFFMNHRINPECVVMHTCELGQHWCQ